METPLLPFNANDVIRILGNQQTMEVDYLECTRGSSRNPGRTHAYYWVMFGSDDGFQDGGKYASSYQMVQAVQKMFDDIEDELNKQNITYVRKPLEFENGYDSVWRSPRYSTIQCVDKIIRIVPCKSFMELQKLLKSCASFDLGVTDIYTCQVCKKRSVESCDQCVCCAQDEKYCKAILDQLKRVYKRGYNVEVALDENYDFDGYSDDRYEYE